MSRFLVAGSNSFSGQDFVDHLLDNPAHEIVGISRSPEKSALFCRYRRRFPFPADRFRFHQIDLNAPFDFEVGLRPLLRDFEPEYIVNFAAQSEVAPSWASPADWYQTNVVALARFAEEARQLKSLRHWLQISTPEVYGAWPGLTKETRPLHPSTPYAASKSAADVHLNLLLRQYGFPVVTVRSANVYGPSQQLWKIIPRAIIRIKQGQKVRLEGGGDAVRSFVHIRDVSRGEMLALERGEPGEVFHLTSKSQMPIRAVVRLICNLLGADFEKVTERVPPRPGADAAYRLSRMRARRSLGWEPEVTLRDGIQGVIGWVEEHWSEIQRSQMEYAHRA